MLLGRYRFNKLRLGWKNIWSDNSIFILQTQCSDRQRCVLSGRLAGLPDKNIDCEPCHRDLKHRANSSLCHIPLTTQPHCLGIERTVPYKMQYKSMRELMDVGHKCRYKRLRSNFEPIVRNATALSLNTLVECWWHWFFICCCSNSLQSTVLKGVLINTWSFGWYKAFWKWPF